jgi:hypothetical protein
VHLLQLSLALCSPGCIQPAVWHHVLYWTRLALCSACCSLCGCRPRMTGEPHHPAAWRAGGAAAAGRAVAARILWDITVPALTVQQRVYWYAVCLVLGLCRRGSSQPEQS